MSVIGFAIQKGGVGKSTTALNFASFLALRGSKTLLIDFDAQANATEVLLPVESEDHNTPPKDHGRRLKDIFLHGVSPQDVILESAVPGLDLLPNDIGFAKAEWKLTTAIDNQYQLRDIIVKNGLDTSYEHVIIDAPPSLGITMLNVLGASQYVVIPLSPEKFSVQGLADFLDTLLQIRERSNPGIRILGAFMNLCDPRKSLHQAIERDVRTFLGDAVFTTRIRPSVKISEANSRSQTIFTYAKKSPVAEDMGALFTEMVERLSGNLFSPDALEVYARSLSDNTEVSA